MICPECGGRVYEATDILQCQDCGRRSIKREFYAVMVECGECGDASLRLSVSRSACLACGSERVNVRAVVPPDGVAIIEGERDAKTS